MSRWFKVPVGTAQNAIFGIIAKRMNLSVPHIIGIFTAAAELLADGKGLEHVSEVLAYVYGSTVEEVAGIVVALQDRGIFDADFAVAGIEKTTDTAERMRRYRERKRNGDAIVTEPLRNALHIDQIRPERPEEKDQTRAGAREGSRSFASRSLGVGSVRSGGFDIGAHLKDDDFLIFRDYCPQWDKRVVMEKYNAYVAASPPKHPRAAFLGWVKKNSTWLGRAP